MDNSKILDWLADLEYGLAECEKTQREIEGLKIEIAAKASMLDYELREMNAAIRKIRRLLEGEDD